MRLAVLAAALALVLSGCALDDPITKSRTESVRGAAWPGVELEQVSLEDGAQVVRMTTPTPEPSSTPSPFAWTFEPPGGATADSGGTPDVGPVAPPSPGRVSWPLSMPPDEPEFEELDHTPSPEPTTDPCDAVGVLPAECDPEPEPCDDAAGDAGEECEPPDCDDPASGGGEPATLATSDTGDGEPTTPPTSDTGTSTPTPSPTGGSGDGEPCDPVPTE